MKVWELRCYLDDGRVSSCPVALDLRPDLLDAVGATMESLVKHRLYEAYVTTEHHICPGGPSLPPELKDV